MLQSMMLQAAANHAKMRGDEWKAGEIADEDDPEEPEEQDDEKQMSDAGDFSDGDDELDELRGTQVNVDVQEITRRFFTLREGTFEGIDGEYVTDDKNSSPKWRKRVATQAMDADVISHCSDVPHVSPADDAPACDDVAVSTNLSAASTPEVATERGRVLASGAPTESVAQNRAGHDALAAQMAARTGFSNFSLEPRPLTDSAVVAAAHWPVYGDITAPHRQSGGGRSGDEYGFYCDRGVTLVQDKSPAVDAGEFDLEAALALQPDAVFTARQQRWMNIAADSAAAQVDPSRSRSPHGSPPWHAPGRRREDERGRTPIWVPFSVIVAALPACDSPQVPGAKANLDEFKRAQMLAKVSDCERQAAKAVAQGRFVHAIEAVENNIRLRARGGLDSPAQLICMLQATAFLCGAYATESIQRRSWDEAAALLDKAQELTRKGVLRKCRETDLVRCGLRAATFHVHALLHRQMGCHGQAVRMLQRALKVTRQKQGLEVTEAATLINLGSVSPRPALPVCACIYARNVCMRGGVHVAFLHAYVCGRVYLCVLAQVLLAQGQLTDAMTIAGAALSLLSNHEVEAAKAWACEATLQGKSAARVGGAGAGAGAGGRAGRSARMNALWAMVAVSRHNLGTMHETACRMEAARSNYQHALEVAVQYLGADSRIAAIVSAAVQALSGPVTAQVTGSAPSLASNGRKCPRQRPAAVLLSGEEGAGVEEQIVSPDSLHRSLVESCGVGYMHWGHAPTELRVKKDDRVKNAGAARQGAAGVILPTLLSFDDARGAPRVDGLGLPAPLAGMARAPLPSAAPEPGGGWGGGGVEARSAALASEAGTKVAGGTRTGGGMTSPPGLPAALAPPPVASAEADEAELAGTRKALGGASASLRSVGLSRAASCPIHGVRMGAGVARSSIISARLSERPKDRAEQAGGGGAAVRGDTTSSKGRVLLSAAMGSKGVVGLLSERNTDAYPLTRVGVGGGKQLPLVQKTLDAEARGVLVGTLRQEHRTVMSAAVTKSLGKAEAGLLFESLEMGAGAAKGARCGGLSGGFRKESAGSERGPQSTKSCASWVAAGVGGRPVRETVDQNVGRVAQAGEGNCGGEQSERRAEAGKRTGGSKAGRGKVNVFDKHGAQDIVTYLLAGGDEGRGIEGGGKDVARASGEDLPQTVKQIRDAFDSYVHRSGRRAPVTAISADLSTGTRAGGAVLTVAGQLRPLSSRREGGSAGSWSGGPPPPVVAVRDSTQGEGLPGSDGIGVSHSGAKLVPRPPGCPKGGTGASKSELGGKPATKAIQSQLLLGRQKRALKVTRSDDGDNDAEENGRGTARGGAGLREGAAATAGDADGKFDVKCRLGSMAVNGRYQSGSKREPAEETMRHPLVVMRKSPSPATGGGPTIVRASLPR